MDGRDTDKEGNFDLFYIRQRMVGSGSFGVVFRAVLVDGAEAEETVAIKKALQDLDIPNRELEVMRRLNHQNITRLKYYFYTSNEKEFFLNFVLEFIPLTLNRVKRWYRKAGRQIPMIYIKVYCYQMFRALGYLHSMGICHRDIKPQNLLVEHASAKLKLCDFGASKVLHPNDPNLTYICSRNYRAPELLLGKENYTVSVDLWSAGCVMGELLNGKIMFAGALFMEIVKILGKPTDEQIKKINSEYLYFRTRMPPVPPCPWERVYADSAAPPEMFDLMRAVLKYDPDLRMSSTRACCHQFFSELRNGNTRSPNGHHSPPLFNFSEQELTLQPELNHSLRSPLKQEQVEEGSPDCDVQSAGQPR